jgi:hypothetical protein
MRTAIFRLVYLLCSFFFTILAYSQEPPNYKDSMFLVYDTLRIKFPKVYWFNSHKFQIENYANGRSKKKVNSVSHSSKKGVQEDITRYKFLITLKNEQFESSVIEGAYLKREYYTTTRARLLENLTGIESESTELLSMSQQKSATITTSIKNDEPWDIVFLETTSVENPNELPALLRSRSRTILLVPASDSQNLLELGIFSHRQFTFLENDVVIGKLNIEGGHLILIQKNMDPLTKLVIISAMMFIYG